MIEGINWANGLFREGAVEAEQMLQMADREAS